MAIDTTEEAISDYFPIQDLPDEILSLILAEVRRETLWDLASVLRVSRRWYKLGEPLIWQHVVLTPHMAKQFASSAQRWKLQSDRLEAITSLTIDIGPGVVRRDVDYHEDMKDLVYLLPAMTSLKTFSIDHRPDPRDPWASAGLTDEAVIQLVSYLPASVRNLEVNSPLIYSRYKTGEVCLCETISNRFEGLKSLRLAYPRVCRRLLQKPSSTLEYLVLNAVKPNLTPCIRECEFAGAQVQNHLSWDEFQEHKNDIAKSTINILLNQLRSDDFVPSHLPRLRKLAIIESHHFKPRHYSSWFLLNVHSLRIDLNDNPRKHPQLTTSSYPIWSTGFDEQGGSGSYHCVLRRCKHADRQPSTDHQCSLTDLIGYSGAICTYLEGNASWRSNYISGRQPSYTHTTRSSPYLSTSTSTITRSRSTNNNLLQTKPEWEESYTLHRLLTIEDLLARTHSSHHPDAQVCTTWPEIQCFRRRFGLNPKELGPDLIWYLERQISQNALWARDFDDGGDGGAGFPSHLTEAALQREFSSVGEAVQDIQADTAIPDEDYLDEYERSVVAG